MRNVPSLLLLFAMLVLLPNRAFAGLIAPGDFGATFEVFNPAPSTSGILYSYDATTDIFSIDGTLGTAGDPAILDAFPLTAPFDVTDIVGTFSLSAIVDDTGTTLSGSFSWIGQSASLGIAAGSTLLAGTIVSVEFILPTIQGFQIVSSVTSANPEIETLYGPINSALIRCTVCPGGAGFNLDPWSVSIGAQSPATQSPSIFGSATVVPEPSTLAIFAIGLAGLGWMGWRRKSNHPIQAV